MAIIPKGLEKQFNILDFSLSSLWRRKLKNLGIMLVFALVIFLLGSFQMLTGALTNSAKAVLENTPEITIQKMSAGRQEAIPLAYKDKLRSIYGIRSIIPRVWGYYFDESNLCLIEWAERGVGYLPAPDLRITLSIQGAGRLIRWVPCSAQGERIALRLSEYTEVLTTGNNTQ